MKLTYTHKKEEETTHAMKKGLRLRTHHGSLHYFATDKSHQGGGGDGGGHIPMFSSGLSNRSHRYLYKAEGQTYRRILRQTTKDHGLSCHAKNKLQMESCDKNQDEMRNSPAPRKLNP